MSYMTPGRFRIGGHGASLSGVDDIELRSILRVASDMADQYCAVPLHPTKHDFRGGTIVGEEINWEIGNDMLPGQRRVYPRHTPLLGLDDFRIEVTRNQYVAFSANEIYVTNDYLEIVSMAMTSFGLFGAAIIPTIGLGNPVARVGYRYGHRFSVAGEVLESDDARQYRAMNQWWHATPVPTVRVDGVDSDPGDYTVDADEGTITFDIALPAGSVVSVDYDHRLPSPVASAVQMIAVEQLGERNLTRKGLHGLVELAVGEVRIRRDFPRAGVQRHGVSDRVMQLLDPYRFVTVR